MLATAIGVGSWFFAGPKTQQPLARGQFEGYNLLFITLDTLRADYLGSYGSKGGFTPKLDRLASEGVRFADLQSHVPLTLPAHASIFSARLPVTHGVHDNGTYSVDASLPTLASRLSAAGYRTGAFVAAFVLDARFGLDVGFDVYDDYYGEKRSFLSFAQLERRASDVVAPAEAFIRKPSGDPWLVWVHLFDAHAPYEAPPPFSERFPDDPYGAEVAYLDDVLGSFLDRLEQSGELDRTLVVVVGDHGESLGEHGERTHGAFAYQAALHVPGLLWAKSGLTPQVLEATVRHVDLLPTLLELLGLPVEEALGDIDGESLIPFLNGEGPHEAPAAYFEALNPHLTQDFAPLRGVTHRGYKLIDLPIPELYNLARDRGESENLYASEPTLVSELRGELDRLLARGGGLAKPTTPDAQTLQRLEALGYVTAPVTARRSDDDYTEADDPKRLIGFINAYEEAKDRFVRGKPEEAVALFEELVRKRPGSSQAYQGLAYAQRQLGRTAEAIATLEAAIAQGVDEPSLLYLLAAYLLDVNDLERAVPLVEELVARDPAYAEGHNYLGIAYGRLGRSEAARNEFEEVLRLDPSSASTHNNLGSIHLAEGEVDRAMARFREALRYDPDLASAHNGLGVAHMRRGETEAAVDAWRRTIELNPEQFDALYNLAMVLAEHAPAEALPYLRRYVENAPPQRHREDIERVRAVLRVLETE